MARSPRLMAGIGAVLLLGAACGILLWAPWHGPIVLSLSSAHGIDAGDLPAIALIALAVALAQRARRRGAGDGARRRPGRWAGPMTAVVLGGLLLAGVFDPGKGEPLLPVGGGTFDSAIHETYGPDPDPVDHWTHVATTYDGSTLHLYVNGIQVASRATTGTIPSTGDPLWIGGNHPYGEYFQGLIDEVRVYDQVLGPSEVRAEMSTPIERDRGSRSDGLVDAYAFEENAGPLVGDASGHGNAGTIVGASRAPQGRFGHALRFQGVGQMVRVPPSPSLDLAGAMTLSAWIRPSEWQDGWRTILARQTDAYYLMASGGRDSEVRLGGLENLRIVLLVGVAVWLGVALAMGRHAWSAGRRRRWWLPVALFLAGCAADAVLAPSGTLIAPALVAVWFAATASHRGEAAGLSLVAAVLAALTVASLGGDPVLELARDDGGAARSAALGALLVAVGLFGVCFGLSGGEQGAPRSPDV